jgi:predicted YcjX-like family ATPase
MASASYLDEARNAALAFGDSLLGLARPRLRIGVTGLSRSGKTVFTTALIQNLVEGAKLPVLKASAEGRIARVRLVPQPDPEIPRFPYEAHRAALSGADRRWPESTRRISELRIEIDYERAEGWFKGPATLTLDIVDYPGEWLLDLALIGQDYADWSAQAVADARKAHRLAIAGPWLDDLGQRDPAGPADELVAEAASDVFKTYLAALRADPEAVAVTPPGRFLMPGDLEGSPALTFAPLDLPPGVQPQAGTLAGLMAERFEAYKRVVVGPFFREHFARLDRQIVLVDALAALDAGPAALADLETALGQALSAFAVGRNSLLSSLFAPRIEKVLFAATKADHLHHTSHDRLAGVMSHLVARAARQGRKGRAPRSRRWPSPRSAPPARSASAKAARSCRPSPACRRRARSSTARCSTGRRKRRSFPATCRNGPRRSSIPARRAGMCGRRVFVRHWSSRMRVGAWRRHRRSASTGRLNS